MIDDNDGMTAADEELTVADEGEPPVSDDAGHPKGADEGLPAPNEDGTGEEEVPDVRDDGTDDDETGGASEEDEAIDSLPSVEELLARVVQAEERQLRLAAEFSNYRRRTERDAVNTWARAQAEVVGRLLDVLDDLDRVREADVGQASVESIMEGINLVSDKFARALTDAGVQVIEPDGEAFDPNTMEAVTVMPAESDEDEDRVGAVLQKGYSLGADHLIRPARVGVLKRE